MACSYSVAQKRPAFRGQVSFLVTGMEEQESETSFGLIYWGTPVGFCFDRSIAHNIAFILQNCVVLILEAVIVSQSCEILSVSVRDRCAFLKPRLLFPLVLLYHTVMDSEAAVSGP